MKLQRLFICALATLALVGCKQSAEFAVGNQSPVVPLIVSEGTTSHFMTDYYPQWVGASNVTTDDARLELKAADENGSSSTSPPSAMPWCRQSTYGMATRSYL